MRRLGIALAVLIGWAGLALAQQSPFVPTPPTNSDSNQVPNTHWVRQVSIIGPITNSMLTGITSIPSLIVSNGNVSGVTSMPALLLTNTNAAPITALTNLVVTNANVATVSSMPALDINNTTGTVPLTRGGSGQITAQLARSPSGFNIEGSTSVGDTNYTILPTDRGVRVAATFTTTRTWTLPLANSVNTGQRVTITDPAGVVSSTIPLVIARAGSDTIDGQTSFTIRAPSTSYTVESNGATKWSQIAPTPSVYPVIQPSSANLQGPGCSASHPHELVWADENVCFRGADFLGLFSSDPSALFQATVGGTVTPGDIIFMKFKFGSGACIASGAGCTISYTVIGGDTTTTIATGLKNAIKAVSVLWTPPSGGYDASGPLFGNISPGASATLSADWDARYNLNVTRSFSGGATVTLSIDTANCQATFCDKKLDVNPYFETFRNPGVIPASGSIVSVFRALAQNDTLANYQAGQLVLTTLSVATGSETSRWLVYTAQNTGTYIGNGAYGWTNVDKGNLTTSAANFDELWTADKNKITRSGSDWLFTPQAGDTLVVAGHMGSSVGNGVAPTLSSCGTSPSLLAGSTDLSGAIQFGTGSPTACTLNFGTNWTISPSCNLSWRSNLASMSYTIGTGTVVLGQTATNSDIVDYICRGKPD